MDNKVGLRSRGENSFLLQKIAFQKGEERQIPVSGHWQQCRPRSDAAECVVSTRFASSKGVLKTRGSNKNYIDTPFVGNEVKKKSR